MGPKRVMPLEYPEKQSCTAHNTPTGNNTALREKLYAVAHDKLQLSEQHST